MGCRHLLRSWFGSSRTRNVWLGCNRRVVVAPESLAYTVVADACCDRSRDSSHCDRNSGRNLRFSRVRAQGPSVCGNRRGRWSIDYFYCSPCVLENPSCGLYTFSSVRYLETTPGSTARETSRRYGNCGGRCRRRTICSRCYAALAPFHEALHVSFADWPHVRPAASKLGIHGNLGSAAGQKEREWETAH
jgi:hypothetical protein